MTDKLPNNPTNPATASRDSTSGGDLPARRAANQLDNRLQTATTDDELPSSYTTLFGPMDQAEGNESRSALSPAAYLVDLLQLRDSVVSDWADYHLRRPDVRDIPLSQANTYTEIPFLDVANTVMEAQVRAGDPSHEPDETLRRNLFPPPLPFAEQQLRLKIYAEKLETRLDEIQRLYRASADARTTARLRLGLSQEESELFSTAHESDQDIERLWGVPPSELRGTDVALVKKKLGLSLKELKQLVRQNLSKEEIDAHVAQSFFINQGENYVVLDEDTPKLQLRDNSALTNQHLDRMMRFVRLARRLDLELQDLDWLLWTACGNMLDEAALQAIAIALDIRRRSEWPMDESCSLWGPLKAHGLGDDHIPADLFDRVYNNDFPVSLEALVAGLATTPNATVDLLDDRLQATLRLSGTDFTALKSAILGRGVARPQLAYDDVVLWFSGFRRIAKLAELLSLSVQEVVMLLDVLGAQWSVSEHDDLTIPMPFSAAAPTESPLALLLYPTGPLPLPPPPSRAPPTPQRTLDVLQKLLRVKEWLDLHQLSPRQLAYICLEDHAPFRRLLQDGSPIDDVQPDDGVESALDELYQSFRDTLLAPATLQTGSLTANGARAVFDSLREAKVLVTFDDQPRGLLRVELTAEELAEAMQQGLRERLAVHPGELSAVGITDLEPLFSVLVSHGYLEQVRETGGDEEEILHFIAPGLESYFSSPTGAASFTVPNFQEHAGGVFSTLAQHVDADAVPAAAIAKTGVEAEDVPALFEVLLAHGYVERLPGSNPAAYRVPANQKEFFKDPANAAKFNLPNFAAVFPVLAAKMEAYLRAEGNRTAEAQELGERLWAHSEQQLRLVMRTIAGLVGLPEDLTQLSFAWAFGTPDETPTQMLATLMQPLFRAKAGSKRALEDAYLASRFRRLQQLGLLLRKTKMSADEARVYLENQQVHQRLPETLKVPKDFLAPAGKIDALTTLPNGDFIIISGKSYAAFSRADYDLLGTGLLEDLPDTELPADFAARLMQYGVDAAFNDFGADGKPVLHLCAGDQYVTVYETETGTGTSPVKPITDWGRVRNNIQENERVDAAVQAADGRLFLFSGDQYFLYSDPQELLAGATFVDERYPRSIRGKFEKEGVAPLPARMFSKVDAAFRDADDSYYFFSGNRFTHSSAPYTLAKIRPAWGHVLNWLFEECRVDAAFVLGGVTYLTRRNQLTRYSGAQYGFVDEGFPISFPNIPESEPLLRVLRRFPDGLDAALAGSDGQLYAFKGGSFASSAAPDTSLTIRDRWGLVRNVFVDNRRVDAAFAYGGAVYLFCGDQYVRYSGDGYQFVDEGYPRRVRPNWNELEQIGLVPDALPLPITAVVVGRAPGGATDDVYFFGGDQYAGPDGALGNIGGQWARVRNNIERTSVVDAAMLDGSGRMYLFSGDQMYRYSSPDQEFVDETYPRRIAGAWPREGDGYSLPDAFTSGLSAALRTGEGKIYFFSGQSYARVDAPQTAQPRWSAQDWGLVRNWIQSQNQVNAAFVDPSGRTYLFGGDQFVRYTGVPSEFADEGYPLAIGNRWGSNLPAFFRSDLDAALSFRSPVDNVQRLYLFKGDQYVRYSTADYSQVDSGYPKPLGQAVQVEGQWFRGLAVHQPTQSPAHDEPISSVAATYVDTFGGQPRIFVFYRHTGGVQWRREYRNGTWQAPQRMDSLTDYRPFTYLDAAFVGADGTLHVFSGNEYASRPPSGGALTTPVSIRSRWARVWNQFADLSRVDAALDMGDGRTYLFCNRQFIKYTGTLRPGAADFYADEGYPLRIDPNWPREGVPMALVPELQAAGYDLCRDATGKIHFFNGTRYTFSGNTGADAPLASRWGKVKNRFEDLGRVDGAYRAENDKLYLFCDTQYTRYSGALQPGAPEFYADEGYPRHVTTGWASEGLDIAMPETWNALGSAVFRDAEQTYVFSGESFTSSQSPAPAPVIPHWAKVRNQMQSQNRVDAGFVLGGATFLFCDDQYVRYSGEYGGFVDEGYPKVIAHLEAADGVFPGLPVQLQLGLRAFFVGTDGQLHAFGPQPPRPSDETAPLPPQLWVSSGSPDALRPLNEKWGIVDNKLWDNELVDAALLEEGGKLFLFSGDQYVRYSGTDRRWVDEGYPRRISTSYAQEIGATALSPIMNQGVDAALTIGDTTFYFVQNQYVSTDHPDVAQPLVNRWGLVENRLQTSRKLDAAFVAPSGKMHLFAQNQVSVYSGARREYVDEEYPRTISNDLGRLWRAEAADFLSDLDAAAGFEGRSYLFKGARHVRISDFRLAQVDAGYPLNNAAKLEDRFDFELGTLPDWWRIKALFDDYSSQNTTALDYLDEPPQDLVSGLMLVTQWPAKEIEALLAILGFNDAGVLRDGRSVARLARCFELAGRIGTVPSKLKSQVWDLAFGSDHDQHEAAADFLYGLIRVATGPKDWPKVARSLLDPVESAKRDALVAHLVHTLPGLRKRDVNELYQRLLLDVEMDASSNTSRIVEAINSIQLFYHRALINLEELPDDEIRSKLKAWWPWMKNYRIWEANRKVFLHPENYIRPELRTEKSPAFEELEQKLLQDEITTASVEESYQRYLESFNEISRLRIVGGYRYRRSANDDERVFMVGLSRTEPPIYHYRLGVVSGGAIDWEPWQKLGITVNAERVQPVYAFNRLFIFWLEAHQFNYQSISTDSGTYSAESELVKQVRFSLKFSFYNFNKEWVPPQTVKVNPANPANPELFPYSFSAEMAGDVHLTAVNPVGDGKDDDIYLKLRWLSLAWDLGQLTAGLDLKGGGSEKPKRDRLYDPKRQFPRQLKIDTSNVTAVIPWGSHVEQDPGEAWFSFDAKGGTFLCRPEALPPSPPDTIFGKPFSDISAAFGFPDGDVFVFTQAGERNTLCYHRYSSVTNTWQDPIFVDDPAWPWGRPASVFQEDEAARIANVVVGMDTKTYFMLGDRFFTYAPAPSRYSAIEEHFVGDLQVGSPSLAQLVGEASDLSWEGSTADGRGLLRAFKHPSEERAVLVTQRGGKSGYVAMSLGDLREVTADQDDHSPFDDWDGLDAVFQVGAPELRAVFTRREKLLIFTWSSKEWAAGTLGARPGDAPGISTAFSGVDGKLYYFCEGQYAEVAPDNLEGNQKWWPVVNRWGRPSLFNWLLSSIDGALVGPDDKVYLFSAEQSGSLRKSRCLSYQRYQDFPSGPLDGLVLESRTSEPPPVWDVWKSNLGWFPPFSLVPVIERVTAAFVSNGFTYVMGQRLNGSAIGQPFAARYSRDKQRPFTPDLGYPMPMPEVVSKLSTDFYAQLLAESTRRYTITRLTSHTSEQFGRELFAGGLDRFLSLATQELDELPTFDTLAWARIRPEGPRERPNELLIDGTVVTDWPGKPKNRGGPEDPEDPDGPHVRGLDFKSSNGFYYWEIFFHIPHLIGQALRQTQRFDEAKHWYEYVFDPTLPSTEEDERPYWRFQEFRVNDAPSHEKLGQQVEKYHEDPFDPHRIAELRPIAYRKAFVMSYLDNLLEWGDSLFRRYTRESIGEATMLYVLAADLLGKKPEELGKRKMERDTSTYADIRDLKTTRHTEEILNLENAVPPWPDEHRPGEPFTSPNDSIFNSYFYIPENEQFVEYWNRVGDRLTKIRHGLDIDGVKRSLALFEPPVDVMALVKAFASGAGLAQALAEFNTPVPHYRFLFMLAKARELTGRLMGLGGALLSALEKKDAEELSLLRNTHERDILELQLQIKQQQLESAKESLAALYEGLKNAQTRETHYQKLLADGLSAYEQEQVAQMITGQVFSQLGNALGIASSVAYAAPQVGSPFAITYGGIQLGNIINGLSGAFKARSEMASFQSSLAATFGGWERRSQDWDLQKKLATGDTKQIGRQLKAAEIQVEVARQEIQVHRRLIKNNESIDTFMRSKFTSQQLYQWMVGKLSAVYFQTYNLALQYSKAAQRAMQFELGLPESSVQYVGVGYWDSLKKGLLSGEQLQLDLDRLENAYLEANQRRMEITRYVSLAQVDPLALVHLKEKGTCEFDLTEALFDCDFPGHYCRQLKSVSLSFPAVVGPYDNFNATLTQLAHRTLLTPDRAALRQLVQGPTPGSPEIAPTVLRADWRPNQQVALSRGVNDSGLFQLNFQDERYLPFEGTGAVATWRLEVNGAEGQRHREALTDVVLTLQYTALQGGEAFAEAAKGLVGKPQDKAWLLNLAYDFPDEWAAFMNKPTDGMSFAVERARLPGATGRQVTGVYLHYELVEEPAEDLSGQALSLNGIQLKPGTSKTGFSLPILEKGQNANSSANRWLLKATSSVGARKLTPNSVKNIVLIVTYSCKPSF